MRVYRCLLLTQDIICFVSNGKGLLHACISSTGENISENFVEEIKRIREEIGSLKPKEIIFTQENKKIQKNVIYAKKNYFVKKLK